MTDQLWYYALRGNREGPVSDAQLREKIATGEVHAETLVWNSSMADWTKAGEVPGLIAPGVRPPPLMAPTDGSQSSAAFSATFGTWELFGRFLLVVVSALLIIPYPWAATSFYRFLVDNVRVPNGVRVHFEGKPVDIWWVFVLIALFGYVGFIHSAAGAVAILVNAFFYVLIIRWFFSRLVWEGQHERLTFTGSYWGLLGWFVLGGLAVITIVGWAWVYTAMFRWICDHVEGSRERLNFVASGWEMLWRAIVFAFSCALIIPIPWTLAWFNRWLISQFTLSARVQA